VALVPEPTVRREVRDGTLAAIALSDLPLTPPTGILLKKGRVRSNALNRFLEALSQAADPGAG
jgi:DNA-binding transcriptional LysR family regulator